MGLTFSFAAIVGGYTTGSLQRFGLWWWTVGSAFCLLVPLVEHVIPTLLWAPPLPQASVKSSNSRSHTHELSSAQNGGSSTATDATLHASASLAHMPRVFPHSAPQVPMSAVIASSPWSFHGMPPALQRPGSLRGYPASPHGLQQTPQSPWHPCPYPKGGAARALGVSPESKYDAGRSGT